MGRCSKQDVRCVPVRRVHLQLITEVRTLVLPADVLRCVVWSLHDANGVKYRGALEFDRRSDFFRQAFGR